MYEQSPAAQPVPASASGSRGPSALALVLVGALAGGVAGGFIGATVTQRGDAPVLQPTGSVAPGTTQVVIQETSVTVDAVKDVLPAVVTVVNKGSGNQPIGSGSGVVVDKARGFVVTNSHVVQRPGSLQASQNFDVILSDGTKLAAAPVGNDPETDVAVLRVQGGVPAQATLGDSTQVPLGAQVVAIGSPGVPGLGTGGGTNLPLLQNSVTSGVVSAKNRRLESASVRDVFLEDLIQTDAPINPGNSGGPLVWASAKQVIGLNTLVVRGSGEEGLGFAISSNTVRKIADELIAHGRVQRGFLGIQYDDNNARYNGFYGLGTSDGIIVLAVQPGTPAAVAGLRSRDVIVKVNGQAVNAEHPLKTVLLNSRPGDRVTLTIVREGRQQDVSVTLGASTSELGLA